MSNDFFSGSARFDFRTRPRHLLRRGGTPDAKQDATDLIELCEALLSGAAKRPAPRIRARWWLDRYHDLDEAGRVAFFETLARSYGPDQEKAAARAIEAWRALPDRRRRQ